MKLSKALKEKNRLIGEMNKHKDIISRENSRSERSTSTINCEKLYQRFFEIRENLIQLKTAIFKANVPIYEHIVRMGELKAEINWLERLPTQDGEVVESHYDGQPRYIKYFAWLKTETVDSMCNKLRLEIDELQDLIDEHNAVTEIDFV